MSINLTFCSGVGSVTGANFLLELSKNDEKTFKILVDCGLIQGEKSAQAENRNDFPYKKCNAPWVSTVVEADGTVRPCFFHEPIGNIKEASLDNIINSETAIDFRKSLDVAKNETCLKCVCYLNLRPAVVL